MTDLPVRVGSVAEASYEVTPDLVASHLGSGSLRVFATPAMALLVERTCRRMVEAGLPQGQSSVGVDIRVRHLAPTPQGKTVVVRAEVVAVEGRTVDFKADVRDDRELVGEAEHRRVVIDLDRFLRRVEAKAK